MEKEAKKQKKKTVEGGLFLQRQTNPDTEKMLQVSMLNNDTDIWFQQMLECTIVLN